MYLFVHSVSFTLKSYHLSHITKFIVKAALRSTNVEPDSEDSLGK